MLYIVRKIYANFNNNNNNNSDINNALKLCIGASNHSHEKIENKKIRWLVNTIIT